MKYDKAKDYEGFYLSLLDMDNLFSESENNSIFSGEGRKAIKELNENNKSSFSYNQGFNVFFHLHRYEDSDFDKEIVIDSIEEY
jgi:hypothetical protein